MKASCKYSPFANYTSSPNQDKGAWRNISPLASWQVKHSTSVRMPFKGLASSKSSNSTIYQLFRSPSRSQNTIFTSTPFSTSATAMSTSALDRNDGIHELDIYETECMRPAALQISTHLRKLGHKKWGLSSTAAPTTPTPIGRASSPSSTNTCV